MAAEPRRSLLYNLGAFFGNIARTVKSDDESPERTRRQVLRTDVQEEVRDTPQGKVTLRRTTVEEIEVQPPPPPPTPPPRQGSGRGGTSGGASGGGGGSGSGE